MLNNISIIIPIATGETAHKTLLSDLAHTNAEIIVSSEGTRAKSLNAGASKATRETLCFLHADTRMNDTAITALQTINPNAINYFKLSYGGGLTELNAHGANLRSKLFALPYGDQGFTLNTTLFTQIGGFPENAAYGEDLLFIRKAKKTGIKLNALPANLTSSPRQYQKTGWLKLTLTRQFQLLKLLRTKL